MKHIQVNQVGEYAGLTHEIQRMLYAGQLDFELVKFQLSRLTQKSMQGIVGQVPTFRQVRAPGSLQPTINRLCQKGWMDKKIPGEVIQHAIESCAAVPSGTMVEVVKIPLWMIGGHFNDAKAVFKAAKGHQLSSDHNSWLPLVLIDQFQDSRSGSVSFLLKKFGRFDRWALTASPGSTVRVRMDYYDMWTFFKDTTYGFVRET